MKSIIKTISVLLLLVILVVALYSCYNTFQFGVNYKKNIFPEGYTGGFGIQPGSPTEYHWVETNEEFFEAVELLKSHGSTFYNESFFVYEGDEFDVKYCFAFCLFYSSDKEKIPYGENPYDRWAANIYVRSYIFLEDVTIDELVYSDLCKYDSYYIGLTNRLIDYTEINNTPVSELQIGEWVDDALSKKVKIFHPKDSLGSAITVNKLSFNSIEINMTKEDIYSILSNGYFENYYIQEDN